MRRKSGKRKAKPGKFAGRSLHVTKPATSENPRNIADVLASVERLAAATLASEPVRVSPSRAQKSLFIVGECRRALAAGDAEGAAWAAWTLAEINGRNKLDHFAERVLRDKANTDALAELSRQSKMRPGYVEAATYAVKKYPAATKPGQIWDALEAGGRKHVNGRIVEVIDDGKRISCTPHAPITQGVFLRTYLPPARKAER